VLAEFRKQGGLTAMRIQHYFMLGLAWLCLVPSALAQLPARDTRSLNAFQEALTRDGFFVNPGSTQALNFVELWCAGTPFPGIEGAGYSNSQQYLQLLVPKSTEDPGTKTNIFQLDPDEAIVLIGRTPPPERYFGFYSFLRHKMMPDGTRLPLFTTLGDAVNNATVKTTGSSPFNAPVALIFTSDQGTDARVRKALERAGYPAAIINTVIFPASMLKLGYGNSADDFTVLLRNALWQNESDGDAYIRNPPLYLFRVTPKTETVANPFPAPLLRVRGTGRTEMDLMNKLGTLRDGIINANPGLYPKDVATHAPETEGNYNIQEGLDPWGDTRDAFILFAGFMPEYGLTNRITLADDEFLMVYGVNHVATGKASYHSVNIYESEVGKVPLGAADDRVFSGTAAPYLNGDPAADLMYAFKVSRNCGQEPNCVTLGIENCPRVTITSNTVLGLAFRMYLQPETKVGAAMPEILYDRVIKFSPRP
jgi:hypothetical protein